VRASAGRIDGQALLDLARRYPHAIVPGYTHTRRAQPVLWPHYLLAYFEMFARDHQRLRRSPRARQRDAARLRRAGRQRFPVRSRRHRPRPRFRFASPAIHGCFGRSRLRARLPATPPRSPCCILSRLAEDWILYSSEEFGWLELGRRRHQRLQPDAAEKKSRFAGTHSRQERPRARRLHSALMVTMKGLPMTYNRDMQEDKEPLFDAADQLADRSRWRARWSKRRA
jgi:argininosuccinate lyase